MDLNMQRDAITQALMNQGGQGMAQNLGPVAAPPTLPVAAPATTPMSPALPAAGPAAPPPAFPGYASPQANPGFAPLPSAAPAFGGGGAMPSDNPLLQQAELDVPKPPTAGIYGRQ
jgi:hypothetical protein